MFVRPGLRRKRIQSAHVAVERAVGEEAEHAGNLDRVVDAALLDVRLADERDLRHRPGFEAALHRGEHRLLVARDHLGLQVPGRKRHEDGRGKAGDGAVLQVQPRLIAMDLAQRVERADGGDREGAGDERGRLVVRELHQRPGVEQIGAEIADGQRAVGGDHVADGVLHEGVGHEDEVGREPAAQRHRHRGEEVLARPEPLLAPDERADERALEQEGKHPFHRERLSDDAARVLREVRPVRPELELHRDAGDHADGEVQPEDLRPEPGRGGVALITGPERAPLPVDEEPGESHRQLRKEIVVGDGEGELKPVPQGGVVHHDVAAPAFAIAGALATLPERKNNSGSLVRRQRQLGPGRGDDVLDGETILLLEGLQPRA